MSPALVLPGREITLLEDSLEHDWYVPQRHYFDPEKDTTEDFHNSLEKAWNFESSLTIHAGHTSIFQWAAENFIHEEDIPDLANENRLPVILEPTCFTGSFQVLGFETLDPDLIDTFMLLGDPAMQLFSTHYSFTSLIYNR